MTYANIYTFRNRACELIHKRKLYSAFSLISPMAKSTMNWDIISLYEKKTQDYQFLLKYAVTNQHDPLRNDMLTDISLALYELTNKICAILLDKLSASADSNAGKPININAANLSANANDDINAIEKSQEQYFHTLSNRYILQEDEANKITELLSNDNSSLEFKHLTLSALYLSLLRVFDICKIQILFYVYKYSAVPALRVKALLYICLCIRLHSQQCLELSAIRFELDEIRQLNTFAHDIQSMIIHLLQTCNTPNLSKRVSDAFTGDMMKISKEFSNSTSLQKKDISLEDLESSPEWDKLMSNTNIQKKIKEFHKLQESGNDVFWNSFSKLKSFIFFSEITNWFRPFSAQNSFIKSTINNDSAPQILSGINKIPNLCDSDKYSLIFAASSISQAQKETVFDTMKQQADNFGDNDLPDNSHLSNIIAGQIHDLYRFHKLHSSRTLYPDVFSTPVNLLDTELVLNIVDKRNCYIATGEVLMQAEDYKDAANTYISLVELGHDDDAMFYQKIAFCFQKQGLYNEAISYYRKHLLVYDNSWSSIQMASCYKSLNDYSTALQILQKIEQQEPDNERVCSDIALLLLEMKEYGKALNQYFKSELLNDSNIRTWRYIAWCSFLLRKTEQSRKYYTKIFDCGKPVSAVDYLNFGHLELVVNNYQEVLSLYKNYIQESGNDFMALIKAIKQDLPSLIQAGFNSDNTQLILDAIAFDIKGVE